MAESRMRFPLLVVALLAMSFVLGGASGALMYATGNVVAQTPLMAMVSHTEYRYSEAGQIIARITDFQGIPVAVNNCTATILYPNKTTYLGPSLMTAGGISGDFYYNFTTPAGPEGVYEYQAICYYNPNKNASVTNSFHLSSAFSSVLGNLTALTNGQAAILANISAVQGNLTALSSQLAAVNVSLAGNIAGVAAQVGNLSANMASNFTYTNSLIEGVNASTQASFTDLNAALAGNFSEIQANVTQILAAINESEATNLTPVLDAIAALNLSMSTYFSDLNAALAGNFSELNTAMAGNFSLVMEGLTQVNTTVNGMTAALAEINATTQSTYTYVTGTLATNVNNILTDLGVINATVNRIETTTNAINTTANTILQNQQDAVNIQVFSG